MLIFTPPDMNDSTTKIVLDSTEYMFRFSYNYMGEFWVAGIYKNTDTPIVAGMKVVPGFPVNFYFKQFIELPQGLLMIDTNLEQIRRDDFVNGKARFVYASKAELTGAKNGTG